jgi:hypothetical protein
VGVPEQEPSPARRNKIKILKVKLRKDQNFFTLSTGIFFYRARNTLDFHPLFLVFAYPHETIIYIRPY